MANRAASEAICKKENESIEKWFSTINNDCPCEGCRTPSTETSNELNFHGDLVGRDLLRYIPVLKERITREEAALQHMLENSLDTTKQEKILDELEEDLESREKFIKPTFAVPGDTPSFDVPFTLFHEEIGEITRVIDNASKHSDGLTVVDYAKQDIDKLTADGGLLYKFKKAHFKIENQPTLWKLFRNLQHGSVIGEIGTDREVVVGITWTRITMVKDLVYQCDQYTPMSFSEHEAIEEETGELCNLTIGEICEMMELYFPLCKVNPLKAVVQFFNRLRKLCKAKNGQIHIPYIVLNKDMKFSGDASLGFDFSQVPTALMDVVKEIVAGVNTAYTYIAILGSFFAIHAEDSNLNSMSVNYGGFPKVWFIMNGEQSKLVHAGLHELVQEDAEGHPVKPCVIQHKTTLIDPEMLRRWGVKFKVFVHTPGSVIFTGSGCLHEGVNTGNGVAKAVNLAFEDVLHYGTLLARLLSDCTCDDINKFVMNPNQTAALREAILEQVFAKHKLMFKNKEQLKELMELNKISLEDMHTCSHHLCQKILDTYRAAEALQNNVLPSTASDQAGGSFNKNATVEENVGNAKDYLEEVAPVEHQSVSEASADCSVTNDIGNNGGVVAPALEETKIFIRPSRSLEGGGKSHKSGYKTYRRLGTIPIIDGRLQCQHCPSLTSFKTKAYLRLHMNKIHFKDPNKTYICQVCNKSFGTEGGCRNHVKQNHTGSTYPCEKCDLIFSTVSARFYHYKTRCTGKRGKPSTPLK